MRGGLADDERADSGDAAGRIPPVVAPFRGEPNGVAKTVPELLLQGRGGKQLPVRGRVEPVAGRTAGYRFAPVDRPSPKAQAVAEPPIEKREQIVRHGDVESTSLAGQVAGPQREEDVHHRRIGPASDIGDQHRRYHRRRRRPHAQRQQPGIADIVQIVSRQRPLGAGLAVTGDRAIDYSRVDRAHRFVVEPETVHDSRAELLHQHVGTRQERPQPRPAFIGLEIEGDRLLAAVEQREVDAVPTPSGLVSAHLLATVGPFDLDDLSARLGQDQARHRPRQQSREIEHQHAVERWRHHRPPRAFATTAWRAGAKPAAPLTANSARLTSW